MEGMKEGKNRGGEGRWKGWEAWREGEKDERPIKKERLEKSNKIKYIIRDTLFTVKRNT